MVLGFLGTIDAGLKALSIPHGAGALEAAAQVLADLTRAGSTTSRKAQTDQSVNQCCG
jgi:alanine-glyoxylate transaminase/serine-glyoxylate transaminase/serine-pyruvate transaminase